MPEPDLVVHLLVPHPDGGRHLAADDDPGPSLPRLAPELVCGGTLVTAVQRSLRSSWQLEPVVLETHVPPPPVPGAGYVGLAVLGPPPPDWAVPAGLSWTDRPPLLPQPIAPRAATWLAEWHGRAAPPALRPRWARSGWHVRAARWIEERLADAGRLPSGPIEMRRLWSISAMARIPTTAGDAWFKAVFPTFRHEPAVTQLLWHVVPGLVPRVIAIEPEDGWLLLEDAGPALGDEGGADVQVLAAIGQLVDAHAASRPHLGSFAALGCPRRPLADLADELVGAMHEAEALGGEAVEGERLRSVAAWVRDQAAWLDGLGMDDVLLHGDFHPANVLWGREGPRLIDWSDAAIGHPVMDIGPWFGEVRPEVRPAGWEAWIAGFSRFGDVEGLRVREANAYAVACAYQVVSYARILRGVERANRYQLSDGFRGYWHDLDARVPA